jgi:hypothetical protein
MSATAEPHHVPHGYVHPKEHHHWWWYAGLAGGCAALGLVILAFCQYDSASSPLCSRDVQSSLASPDGEMTLDVARVSCLGGGEHLRLLMHKGDGEGGHTVASFDGEAQVRAQWASEHELEVSQSGGRLGTFEPIWGSVRIHYHGHR